MAEPSTVQPFPPSNPSLRFLTPQTAAKPTSSSIVQDSEAVTCQVCTITRCSLRGVKLWLWKFPIRFGQRRSSLRWSGMRREVLWVLVLLPTSFLETMARLSLEVPWSTGASKSLCLCSSNLNICDGCRRRNHWHARLFLRNKIIAKRLHPRRRQKPSSNE